jgi:hypothetical protein
MAQTFQNTWVLADINIEAVDNFWPVSAADPNFRIPNNPFGPQSTLSNPTTDAGLITTPDFFPADWGSITAAASVTENWYFIVADVNDIGVTGQMADNTGVITTPDSTYTNWGWVYTPNPTVEDYGSNTAI